MPTFFITHSWKDIEFAQRLCKDLRASGLEGFFDAYSIKPGDDIAARVNKGLEECDVYIPVLSFAAFESPWCNEEINAAITLSNQLSRQGKPRIISALIEDCAAKMPPLLRNRLHVNFVARYLQGLWDLLDKGFGIDPKSQMRQVDMLDGPIINTRGNFDRGGEGWFGAYEVITFAENDAAIGKTLSVTVDSTGRDISIELWQGAYHHGDPLGWVRTRVDVTRSPRQRNPTLTWTIKAGTYTLYFVDQFSFTQPSRSWAAYGDHLPKDFRYHILYQIEIF
jgi:hypothetical protein